ncbi:GyrI-like domain-containing protein [Nocardioides sp. Bht2]|uniref:GyrI-like domain-containing protein n=1 Tax=Nocardioides sp. Bht2 TaxID=3392297 RepID=UPI0039B477D4
MTNDRVNVKRDEIPLILSPQPLLTPTVLSLPDEVAVVQLHNEGVTLADLPGIFDAGYSVLAGLGPIGPGFAIYSGDVASTFDLTIGFPVAGAPTPPGIVPTNAVVNPADLPDGVEHGTFPSGNALVKSHLGSFDGLGPAWAALLETPDLVRSGPIIEIYVTDPSVTPMEEWRTDLVVPLG